jgi:hypothetical protein
MKPKPAMTAVAMTIIELHEKGVIDYLNKKGIISESILYYIQYYLKFKALREQGKTYRESVRILSEEYKVSETTIKKGVRLILNSLK